MNTMSTLPELIDVRDNARAVLLVSRRNFEGAANMYAYYPTAKNAQVLQDAALDLRCCWLLERSASQLVENHEVNQAQATICAAAPQYGLPGE